MIDHTKSENTGLHSKFSKHGEPKRASTKVEVNDITVLVDISV